MASLLRQRRDVVDLGALAGSVEPPIELYAHETRAAALPLLLRLLRDRTALLQLQKGVSLDQLHRPGGLTRLQVFHGLPHIRELSPRHGRQQSSLLSRLSIERALSGELDEVPAAFEDSGDRFRVRLVGQ